jgi:uncharacterized protein (DUF885 family)
VITRMGLVIALGVLAASGPGAQQPAIDGFFERFTAEWMRGNPSLAVSARYFSGPEQDALERQLTPLTREWQRERVRLAERGLKELRGFDRARMTDSQRVSANLMDWQLETIAAGSPFQDDVYPLEQFGGANVNLVGDLTVSHPLQTEKDAANYLARLAAVGTRMGEAVT